MLRLPDEPRWSCGIQPASGDLDATAVVAASRQPGEPWFVLEQPDRDAVRDRRASPSGSWRARYLPSSAPLSPSACAASAVSVSRNSYGVRSPKIPPVGPSSGRVASQTIPAAPS